MLNKAIRVSSVVQGYKFCALTDTHLALSNYQTIATIMSVVSILIQRLKTTGNAIEKNIFFQASNGFVFDFGSGIIGI